MAVQRPNRLRYTLLKSRRTPLQECLDSRPSERRRKCCKNFLTGFLLIIILHYSYTFFFLANDIYGAVTEINNFDEFLTTQALPEVEAKSMYSYKTVDHLRQYGVNITLPHKHSILPRCIKVTRTGINHLNISNITLADVERAYPMVKAGGYYSPANCSTKQEIAIIVAYRDRETNLAIFLHNLHPFLIQQQLEYQIFVIEQSGNDLFNKGRLFNVGFKEVVKLNRFRCFVFHDLDLLPAHNEIQYNCPTLPRHMSPTIDCHLVEKLGQDYKFKSWFGGVISMTVEMYARVNGYSNVYFGWGGEDNDMFWRLRAAGYPIVRYNKTIGIYTVLPHTRAPTNRFRQFLLAKAVERYKIDGLSNLEYNIVSNTSHHLYTYILADINPRRENITALTLKWATSDYT